LVGVPLGIDSGISIESRDKHGAEPVNEFIDGLPSKDAACRN